LVSHSIQIFNEPFATLAWLSKVVDFIKVEERTPSITKIGAAKIGSLERFHLDAD